MEKFEESTDIRLNILKYFLSVFVVLLPQVPAGMSFGTVAINVHRMSHHGLTVLTPRASGLSWTSAGLPHVQGVHKNLPANPVDPSSLLQKLTRYNNCFMHTEFHTCLLCPPQCGLYSFRAYNETERLSPVDLGISRGVTDLHRSRGYAHPVTRAIEISHAASKAEF